MGSVPSLRPAEGEQTDDAEARRLGNGDFIWRSEADSRRVDRVQTVANWESADREMSWPAPGVWGQGVSEADDVVAPGCRDRSEPFKIKNRKQRRQAAATSYRAMLRVAGGRR